MAKVKYDKNTVIDAIRGAGRWASGDGRVTSSGGNVSVVAKRLGVNRTTVMAYMKRWKAVADAIHDERETLIDMTENKAVEKIMSGDTTMIIFTLKAHPVAKARGWSEKIQQEQSGDVTIRVVDARE